MMQQTTGRGVFMTAAALFLATACGAGGDSAAELSGEIHTCEIAPAGDVSRIFAAEVLDASPSMESANGKTAYSQCTYRFAGGGMGLSLQIRRSGTKTGSSRQADADALRKRKDSLGIGEDTATAIETGTDIEGLGDVAYEFDDQGNYRQLVVYWNDYYQLAILSFGDTGDARTAEARQALARHVIERL
jgi:hypothetical protein